MTEHDDVLLRLSRKFGERAVTAVISRRAAALRMLRVDDIDLVEPTTRTTDPPGMAGAILAPWPNRVEDASWWLNGHEHRLTVTEPELGHANHGLLTSTDYSVHEQNQDTVTLDATIAQPAGYPFDLHLAVSYRLCEDGIATSITVRNLGDEPAPVALGAHPYLRIGDVPTAQLRLSLDADHVWPLDERHVPIDRQAQTMTDVLVSQSPRHATYERSAPGRELSHTLTAPDGSRLTLTADAAHRFTQLWIADQLDSDDGSREAIAIEPMTAPPNALRTGVGLRWVRPDEAWTTGWSLGLSRTVVRREHETALDRQPAEFRVR